MKESKQKSKLFFCKYLLTMDEQAPIENAFLLIENGIIKEIGRRKELSPETNIFEIIDLGNSILMPGLINSHIHLSYTNCSLEPYEDEIDWLQKVINQSRSMNKEQKKKIAKDNIDKVLKSGCTFVVENTPFEESIEAIAESKLKALAGIEVFGNSSQEAKEIFQNSLTKLATLEKRFERIKQQITFTFSPHSIYNVSAPLLQLLSGWAKEENKFLLLHLAEFDFESELTTKNRLPDKLISLYKLMGSTISEMALEENPNESTAENLKFTELRKPLSPVQYLKMLGCLHKKMLLTHLINVSEKDINFLIETEPLLAMCLRSNLFLHKKTPPISLINESLEQISCATDGLSSNKDLDLLAEIHHNWKLLQNQNSKITAQSLFQSITSLPAKKLGLSSGIIQKGLSADLLCLKPKETSENKLKEINKGNPAEIFSFMLENFQKFDREVWIDGEKV